MRHLELLAPARNAEIGIAAIDCGADAVYIGAPDFGARKAAGNSIDDIRGLCAYAHRFGARVFVTFNTLLKPEELEEARAMMMQALEAGADAFIVRDPAIFGWKDISVPLHASTQCAIRTPERARLYEDLGCARIVLERELSLDTIREIASAVSCEIEFFVHGALCVCYSGECRLSERINGRSADRGECIQACRSLYDLVDGEGRVLAKNKALLSLKDYNLRNRLEDLAEAGVISFKIEGRLKNASYVKTVVRDYSMALDELVSRHPDLYARASFGIVRGGFRPDCAKAFNRGFTELFLDGKRGRWSSMDAPKSIGEPVGKVIRIRRQPPQTMHIELMLERKGLELRNGDGFAFLTADGITGFRGDVCDGVSITARNVPDLREGMTLYRNINTAYEKTLESGSCRREIPVSLSLRIHGKYVLEAEARSQDGRVCASTFHTDLETADNSDRIKAMLHEQLSKHAGIYSFSLDALEIETPGGRLPLLSASTMNGIRRMVAEDLDALPCRSVPLAGGKAVAEASELAGSLEKRAADEPLMRTKYCIRYELGLCPRHQGAKATGELFLLNNGRKFALGFDCTACEMTVSEAQR